MGSRRAKRIAYTCALAGGLVAVTLGGFARAFRVHLPPSDPGVTTDVAAPNTRLVGKSGEVTLRKELEGHPSIVVIFRGTWCPYCRKELSRLGTELGKHSVGNLRVIGISTDPPEAQAELREKIALPFDLLSDQLETSGHLCRNAMHCVLLYDSHAVLQWAGYAENWSAAVDYGTVIQAARDLP